MMRLWRGHKKPELNAFRTTASFASMLRGLNCINSTRPARLFAYFYLSDAGKPAAGTQFMCDSLMLEVSLYSFT